jgi:hypothetical protein
VINGRGILIFIKETEIDNFSIKSRQYQGFTHKRGLNFLYSLAINKKLIRSKTTPSKMPTGLSGVRKT